MCDLVQMGESLLLCASVPKRDLAQMCGSVQWCAFDTDVRLSTDVWSGTSVYVGTQGSQYLVPEIHITLDFRILVLKVPQKPQVIFSILNMYLSLSKFLIHRTPTAYRLLFQIWKISLLPFTKGRAR